MTQKFQIFKNKSSRSNVFEISQNKSVVSFKHRLEIEIR